MAKYQEKVNNQNWDVASEPLILLGDQEPKEYDTTKANALTLLRQKGIICSQGKDQYLVKVKNFGVTEAKALLSLNDSNRKVSNVHLDMLARAMQLGEYDGTPPLYLSDDGRLVDGQHRCFATIRSKKTFDQNIIVNVNSECQEYLDQNRKRTAGDTLVIQGYNKGHLLPSLVSALLTGQKLLFNGVRSQKNACCDYSTSTKLGTWDVKRLYEEHADAIDFVLSCYFEEGLAVQKLPTSSVIPIAVMVRAYYHENKKALAKFIRIYREQNMRDPSESALLNIVFAFLNKISKRSLNTQNYWITAGGKIELYVTTEKAIRAFCNYIPGKEDSSIPSFSFHKSSSIKEIYPVATLDKVTKFNDLENLKKQKKERDEIEEE